MSLSLLVGTTVEALTIRQKKKSNNKKKTPTKPHQRAEHERLRKAIRKYVTYICVSIITCVWWQDLKIRKHNMGCPPVRGDIPRAAASGLSYVQVDKHGITILYLLHQCRHCAS